MRPTALVAPMGRTLWHRRPPLAAPPGGSALGDRTPALGGPSRLRPSTAAAALF